jgi:hypothetical protein
MNDDPLQGFHWFSIRRAQNLKPMTYICPLCDEQLLAMSDHVLILPEDDPSKRRHAHADCVARARRTGRLPSRDEWRQARPATPGRAARLRRRP